MTSPVATRVAVVAIVLAYAWWATSLAPFSTLGLLAVLFAGFVVIVVRRRSAREDASTDRVASDGGARWPWFAVIAAIGAWELQALFQHPRHAHPTISSILDPLEQWHGARLVLFLGWLWLGWELAS